MQSLGHLRIAPLKDESPSNEQQFSPDTKGLEMWGEMSETGMGDVLDRLCKLDTNDSHLR